MSISTEYFDYVFDAKEEVAVELEWSTKKLSRLERKQDRLESLIANKSSASRLRRLERVTGLIDTYEQDVDLLTGELADLNEIELPKDEVTYSIWNPRGSFTGIQVTIADSPYDDSFIGGQKTALYLSGTGRRHDRGGIGSFSTRTGLVPETFEDDTKTFGIAGNHWTSKVDGSYPDVTVSLLQGYSISDGFDFEQSFITSVCVDGVVQI